MVTRTFPETTPVARRQRLLGWTPVAVAVIGVLVAAFLILRPTPGSAGLVGRPAPDFTLPLAGGGSVHLAALRGHPVLINFWGVSCPPCRREAPLLQQASQHYRGQGLVILGLDAQGDDAQSVTAFASERGITYPMVLGAGNAVAPAYGAKDLPQSFLVDRNGIVREADPAPFLDPGPLARALRTIL